MANLKVISVDRLEKNWVEIKAEYAPELFEASLNKVLANASKEDQDASANQEQYYNAAINEMLSASYNEIIKAAGIESMVPPAVSIVSFSEDKTVVLAIRTIDRPVVTLGQYKGITIKKEKVTDTYDLKDHFNRQVRSTVPGVEVSRPAKLDDEAVIDFTGYKDGEEFKGGKGENYPLVLGSGTFIPGFEDQIVGHSAGEEFDVNVTFPERYSSKELAGQAVVFKVKLNAVKEKPILEYTDENVKKYFGFDSTEEYEETTINMKNKIKQQSLDKEWEDKVAKQAVDNAEVFINDEIAEIEANILLDEAKANVSAQGMDFKTYLEIFNKTEEAFKKSFKNAAYAQVKSRLVFQEIAKKEGFTISPEELKKEYMELALNYGVDVDVVKSNIPEDTVITSALSNKAYNLIIENAIDA